MGRFEIEFQDSRRDDKLGCYVNPFKIRDAECSEGFVTDDKGGTEFFDAQDLSDVPSYVNRYVTLYRTDRCYGGPEEGGWYYNDKQVVISIDAERCSVEEVKAFMTKNYAVDSKGNDDLSLVVELTKGSLVKNAPRYE